MSQASRMLSHRRCIGKLLTFLLFLALAVQAQSAGAQTTAAHKSGAVTEEKTARYFESIRTQPPMLLAFLRRMPKGADLHNHLSGSIYAESYIQWAAQTGLCVSVKTFALSPAPCTEDDRPPVSQALTDGVLYRQLIDAWSMRNWELSGQSGHDHFFDTFGKFGGASGARTAEMLAEATSRAASEHVSYLELMLTPDGGRSSQLGRQLGWNDDFSAMREKLLAGGLREGITDGIKSLDEAEAKERTLLQCGKEQADAGCNISVRYIFQVGRAALREQVFAQMLAAFEMAGRDARLVGLNLVQAEDSFISMRDFSLHMRMLDYLHALYPKVHITLHAGELAAGLVPPEGLRSHIRESIVKGHAERIGHGVDVMEEDRPQTLLGEMRRRGVLVEICLTSNDVILGVRGNRHPLAAYLKSGVPVALATDDLGVSRSDMTHEYLKAAEEQAMDYRQLKTMARASLQHSFLSGSSLWRDAQKSLTDAACATDKPESASLSNNCQNFLKGSEKARLQWELERAFAEFERDF